MPYVPPSPRRAVLAPLLVAGLVLATPAAAQEIPGLPGAGEAAEVAAGPAPGTVEAEATPEDDLEIEERLREIYSTVAGLEGIEPEVRSGVVVLSGEALSSADRERAVRIARQLRGVVEVEERIAEVRDVERRLAPAFANLRERLWGIAAALPLLGVALAIFLAFALLARWVGRWRQPYERLAPNRFLRDLLRQAVRALLVLAGAILALETLDATALVAAVAGAAGLAGLALGFALRDLVENYVASVLLSVRQPFLPNDHVVIEGQEGRVVRLTSRATILMTLEGNHVRIPNADVFKGTILNYSRNPRRRFDFRVGVDVATDLAAAIELAVGTLDRMEGVLDDPPPHGWVVELGESNVVLHLFGWMDQRRAEWAKVRGEAIRVVKEAFDAAGIGMPEPIYDLRVRELEVRTGAGAEGEERPRPAEEAAASPAPSRPAAETVELELDISRDTHLDREVAADRTGPGGEDLLDPAAPME